MLNPQSRYYDQIKKFMEIDYEDNYWSEDALFMERNSRDFVSRIDRINKNAEAICDALKASPIGGCTHDGLAATANHSHSEGGLLPEI